MLFGELLQVAVGNKGWLSTVPSLDEWNALYDESERQAVTGLILHGIDRLPLEQRPPKAILLQWIGIGQMIEQRNQVMDEHCLKLQKLLEEHGLKGSILKGQGVALLYDDELRPLRQSGDIDVYVDCGLKGALAFAKSIGQKDVEWDYKHLHLKIWNGIVIEMHYRVEVLLNLWKNRKLQKWFKEHQEEVQGSRFLVEPSGKAEREVQGGEIVTPTVEVNVFYILLHIYRHFLYEGVGMRQIVDYYMVLRTVHDSHFKIQDYVDAVRVFGMEKFAKGMMWVMKETLGMPEEWMFWEPDKKEGAFILNSVMKSGNFGHYDERLNHTGGKNGAVKAILTHNLHLLTHYPADTIWAPVWIVWHKLWKITTRMAL